MDYPSALLLIKDGARVARSGWNGKGMWIMRVASWQANLPGQQKADGNGMPDDWRGYLPFIAMYTADKYLVPWLCSQTDMLATDWELVLT